MVLFIIAKQGKEPKRPASSECINEMWYSQIVEYDLAINSNEVLLQERIHYVSYASERRQTQKAR